MIWYGNTVHPPWKKSITQPTAPSPKCWVQFFAHISDIFSNSLLRFGSVGGACISSSIPPQKEINWAKSGLHIAFANHRYLLLKGQERGEKVVLQAMSKRMYEKTANVLRAAHFPSKLSLSLISDIGDTVHYKLMHPLKTSLQGKLVSLRSAFKRI